MPWHMHHLPPAATTTGFGQMTENNINGFLWWKSIPQEKFS
jgi:hypothetical protein